MTAYLVGGDGDLETIGSAASSFPPGSDLIAEKIARDIVEREMSSVRSVAAALIDRGTLTYADVVELVGS